MGWFLLTASLRWQRRWPDRTNVGIPEKRNHWGGSGVGGSRAVMGSPPPWLHILTWGLSTLLPRLKANKIMWGWGQHWLLLPFPPGDSKVQLSFRGSELGLLNWTSLFRIPE